MSAAPLVEVTNLRVVYGPLVAVRNVSFTIPKGEVFGFIGPNGAGKSSTIRVLATLQRPTGGRAVIAGHDVARAPQAVRQRIGYMPDSFGVYDDLDVEEYLLFFAAVYGIGGAERTRVVGDALALVELDDKRKSRIDALSRGMKQRLGLARVLLHDPELLLLDEPASGLDPRSQIEIRELLIELARMGKTILISSHHLHELARIATRIGILDKGAIVAEGPLDEILARIALTQAVQMRITNADEALLARLAAIPGVLGIEPAGDGLKVEIREAELAPEDLLERAIALGARVALFQPATVDIETAFLRLTEGRTS